MSITTTNITDAYVTVYTSIGNSAVSLMSICNHHATDAQTVSVNIVPSGVNPPTSANIFIKDITIIAGDTFILYQGGEKLILGDGDYISVIGSTLTSTVTAIVSHITI